MEGTNLQVIFDMKDRIYLPEVKQIQQTMTVKGCNAVCSVESSVDYEFYQKQLETDEKFSERYTQLKKFQEEFNNKHMVEIKLFLKSTMATYKIDKYCVKIIKTIKFLEYVNNNLQNRATMGDLDDLYEGEKLNTYRMGILFGFRTENLESMILIDRKCIYTKVFGRSMEE